MRTIHLNHRVYFFSDFEDVVEATNFAIFWRGVIRDEAGNIVEDFSKLPE